MRQAANSQQRDAIEALDGPLLIVAGPGSGKTYCLVERTANRIENREIAPERILVSTFTEKAAKELKTRIAERVRLSGKAINPLDLTIGTLHAIFLDLIDGLGPFPAFAGITPFWTNLINSISSISG